MGILDKIFEVEQVFISAVGEYYLGFTRAAPEDSHIPSPSPTLVTLLKSAKTELGIDSVGVQVAQDVVASTSIPEPAIPSEVTAPPEVTTENPAPESIPETTIETANLNP